MGLCYNSSSLNSFADAISSQEPTIEVVAFTLGSGQSAVGTINGNFQLSGSFSVGLVVQVEGNFVLVAGVGSMCNDPAVLDLRSAVVLAQDTVNSDSVACDGLYSHILVGNGAISVEGTVNGQLIAFCVYDVHIAVVGIVNFLNDTGNLILGLGEHIVGDLFAGSVSLLDGDLSAIFCRDTQFLSGGNLGSFAFFEGKDPAVLDLGSAVVVTNNTQNGDGVACVGLGGHSIITILAVLAVCTVQGQNVTIAIGNLHVTILGVVNLSDNAGDLILLIGVNIVLGSQCHVNGLLHGQGFISSSSGIGVFPLVQGTALSKFYFTLVVGDHTGNGDGVTFAKSFIFYALASQTVNLDGLIVHACNHDGNSDVTEGGVVVFVDLGDLTGQSCLVGQSLVFLQGISFLHDLLGIGGSLHFGTGLLDLQQRTAFAELNAALIVYDVTLDGDGVTDQQGICAFALNAVAQQFFAFVAFDLDGNGDILERGVIGGVDLGDLTGQGSLILGGTAFGQLKSFLHDGCHIGGSFHFTCGSHRQQHTASLELDLTLIVGQDTGNGDGIAGLQVFSAFALQTVALNGLALDANHIHGNGDILVAIVIGSVNLVDHTGQGDFVVHGSALLQSIGFVHDSAKVQIYLGNDVLPAVGNHLVAILDGSGQGVMNFLRGGLVHVDGNSAVGVLYDLNELFGYVNRPNNFVGLAVYRHGADTGEVTGGFLRGLLVEGLDIHQRCIQTGLGAGGAAAGFLLHAGGQAGAKAQAECQNQDKCE